jgi:hypothetical protein
LVATSPKSFHALFSLKLRMEVELIVSEELAYMRTDEKHPP